MLEYIGYLMGISWMSAEYNKAVEYWAKKYYPIEDEE